MNNQLLFKLALLAEWQYLCHDEFDEDEDMNEEEYWKYLDEQTEAQIQKKIDEDYKDYYAEAGEQPRTPEYVLGLYASYMSQKYFDMAQPFLKPEDHKSKESKDSIHLTLPTELASALLDNNWSFLEEIGDNDYTKIVKQFIQDCENQGIKCVEVLDDDEFIAVHDLANKGVTATDCSTYVFNPIPCREKPLKDDTVS